MTDSTRYVPLAILLACGLLLVGVVLRSRVGLLRLLFIPAAVVGGIVGLALLQIGEARPANEEMAKALALTLRSWPGPLLAIVFAGLLLENPSKSFRDSMRGAALAGIMVWIIVLGEVVLGLTATWLVIRPSTDVPAAFGQLIEAGFAGGHATATALGQVFEDNLDFPAGRDLGLIVATVGLVYGVVTGIAFVNLGVRRGWTRSGAGRIRPVSEREDRRDPKPIAFGRVRSEIIDPLAFQVLLIAAAVAVGVGLQWVFVAAAGALPEGDLSASLGNIPLFLFTLIGGWIVRRAMGAMGARDFIDGASIRRCVGISMEFLIVAAMASLQLSAMKAFIGPLALLLVLAFAWTAFCLLFLSRRLLPADLWFELGILNYGMSTGTTAQGMMLLRIVDQDLESGAAEYYAMAAPLSAPFIGGGIVTLTLPLILLQVEMAAVIGVLVLLMVALYASGRRIRRGPPRPPP